MGWVLVRCFVWVSKRSRDSDSVKLLECVFLAVNEWEDEPCVDRDRDLDNESEDELVIDCDRELVK